MNIDINSYKTGQIPGGFAKRSSHGLWLSLLDDAQIESMLPPAALAQSKDQDPSRGTNYVFVNGEPVGSGSDLLVAVYFRPHPKRATKDVGWIANYLLFTTTTLVGDDRDLALHHMKASIASLDTATDGKGAETLLSVLSSNHVPDSIKKVFDGKLGSGKWRL